MATVFNKLNPEIIANRRPTEITFITVTVRGFYFPKQTSFLIGASEDLFIHFINDGSFWAFYINKCRDGFNLNEEKPGSFKVDNAALSKIFIKSTGKKPQDRFLIKKTGSVQNGSPIFEIFTQHTAETLFLKEKEAAERRKHLPIRKHLKIAMEPTKPTPKYKK